MQDYAEAVAAARDAPPTERCIVCGRDHEVVTINVGPTPIRLLGCPLVPNPSNGRVWLIPNEPGAITIRSLSRRNPA